MKEVNDGRIYFKEPTKDLNPPPVSEDTSQNYFLTQQNTNVVQHQNHTVGDAHQSRPGEQPGLPAVTLAVTDFGLRLLKTAYGLKTGNIIMSPTSIAMLVALLQQGATGEAQEQITRALNMSPDFSKTVFGLFAANVQNRNSRNALSVANSLFVSDTFELNDVFRSIATNNFLSEVFNTNFANPLIATQKINAWIASKTQNKITNLLQPGTVSPATQLVLLNAVYFKGVWKTKFNPEKTESGSFHLSNGEKKLVPFMSVRNSFQVGYDRDIRLAYTILPFEGNQYSLMIILPATRTDTVPNVLSMLTPEKLLKYQSVEESEILVEIPKFTLKIDTDLNPVLKNMNITNIFASKSELTRIGLYRSSAPQISNAIHSGYLSIDEEGVTAAATSGFVAIALSFDDSSSKFRVDKPFIAVLWDNQLSMSLFMSTIEDPSF